MNKRIKFNSDGTVSYQPQEIKEIVKHLQAIAKPMDIEKHRRLYRDEEEALWNAIEILEDLEEEQKQ